MELKLALPIQIKELVLQQKWQLMFMGKSDINTVNCSHMCQQLDNAHFRWSGLDMCVMDACMWE